MITSASPFATLGTASQAGKLLGILDRLLLSRRCGILT